MRGNEVGRTIDQIREVDDTEHDIARWPDYVKSRSLVIPGVFNTSRKILVTF